MTVRAHRALEEADVVVGYRTYTDLIKELTAEKEVLATGMMDEVRRCTQAVELAESGKKVALISSGDAGIYGMAGLALEIIKERGGASFPMEVVPGVPALAAAAAVLGAPLMHDFASISLSDLLTPWPLIEKRLDAAASADFVICLYNPKSKGRAEQIGIAREIIMRHRGAETPVGIVKNAKRDGETIAITTLDEMLNYPIDMTTLVIVGNSNSFIFDRWMVTPRGYRLKEKG